ncbi:MAG: hypothetical protein CVT47_04215 [Thermoplasmata archaeon HGW-Thermoplasmata-2]|nr:MAG: hypothetical protein CVT47_04215 [Thermoplasmata archaeon HGW-Thermoplasmata-2]
MEIVPFIDDVPSALASADVVIQRAGASAVAEVCAVGRGREVTPLSINDINYLRSIIAKKSSELGRQIAITSSEGVWEKPFSECVMSGRVFPEIMGCSAGRTCLAISPAGEVRACLLYQHVVGNLREQDFPRIWEGETSRNLKWLRQVKDGCDGCGYASICSGPCPMQVIISSEQRRCFVDTGIWTGMNEEGRNEQRKIECQNH